ncbi:4596_t:CDS:1 [Paraglomus occultum]|uniref:4596_t:CDS:1 n=1 Tax=Paraglomus occultum TaxID=144539 RepID=A0A9N8ZLD6_9GLOM|nr:4596_t:CDS:1 [Paraglomus occultum]
MSSDTQPQTFLLQTTFISSITLNTILLAWVIIHSLTDGRIPPQLPILRRWTISGRTIGFMCVVGSLLFNITADVLATIAVPDLSFLSTALILWTLAYGLKASAVFISLERYYTVTKNLVKEAVVTKRETTVYAVFSVLSLVLVYPSLLVILLTKATSWYGGSLPTSFYFTAQLLLASILYIKLNRRIGIVLDEGLCVGRRAIRELRKFRRRNFYMIAALGGEVVGGLIWNVDMMTGMNIYNNLQGGIAVQVFRNFSCALVYICVTWVIFPPTDFTPQPGAAPVINLPYTHSLASAKNGFSSLHLRSYLKRNNHTVPFGHMYPKPLRGSFDSDDIFGDDDFAIRGNNDGLQEGGGVGVVVKMPDNVVVKDKEGFVVNVD